MGNPGGDGWNVAEKITTKYPNSFKKIVPSDNLTLIKGDIISYSKGTKEGKGFSSSYGHTAIAISGNSSQQVVADQWASSGTVRRDTYSGRPIYCVARPLSS